MKTSGSKVRLMLLTGLVAAAAPAAFAGGPFLTQNREPTLWARGLVRGGPLGSATVDAADRVLYRVDSGALGTLTEAQATAFVDRLFKAYTDVPTATIAFVNAGRIRDPATRQPVDVNGSNFGKFLGLTPTFQNPIIFDSNGAIIRTLTGDPLVLGFAGAFQIDPVSNSVTEGQAVVNAAAAMAPPALSTAAFLGTFAHEFGHFAGPLDHAQINNHYAHPRSGAALPPGFTRAQAYDLFAPFSDTLYPFLFPAPVGSQLAALFPDSGYFDATLDMDTQNALSALYPTPGFAKNLGAIEGRVVVRTPTGDIPVSGINVVARRIDQGVYPPVVGTQAFTAPPALDADGVPEPPQPQAATDPLGTASSAVTGLTIGAGRYRIQGLPTGEYLLEIQQITSGAVAPGSTVGPLEAPFPLPIEEFYSGPRESGDPSDQPGDFEGIPVAAGGMTKGIDIVLNGFSDVGVGMTAESEPNHITPQSITIPSSVTGAAVATGPSLLDVDGDKIEDLYRFTLSDPTRVYIMLDPISGRGGFLGEGDLDLYLFTSAVNRRMSSLSDPNLLDTSFFGKVEMVGPAAILQPGTYLIGVSAFAGIVSYHLHVFAEQAGSVTSQ